MRLTNTYTRVAILDMDAGELRGKLAHELYQWQLMGSRSSDWVNGFRLRVKNLARMVGKTPDEVYQELQEDAKNMGEEEDLDRTSAKEAKQKFTKESPFKICTGQGLKPHSEKWRRCVEDIKDAHGMSY